MRELCREVGLKSEYELWKKCVRESDPNRRDAKTNEVKIGTEIKKKHVNDRIVVLEAIKSKQQIFEWRSSEATHSLVCVHTVRTFIRTQKCADVCVSVYSYALTHPYHELTLWTTSGMPYICIQQVRNEAPSAAFRSFSSLLLFLFLVLLSLYYYDFSLFSSYIFFSALVRALNLYRWA